MQEDAFIRMRLANDLRHALRLKQLEVYYQPIVSLQDGNVVKRRLFYVGIIHN